jgi:P27 family predicted phage terminase small subunit
MADPENVGDAGEAPSIPEAPIYLNDLARARWNEVWLVVDREAVKPSTHAHAVAAYCSAHAEYAEASRQINAVGVLFNRDGALTINPLLRVRDNALETVTEYGRMIGLEPGYVPTPLLAWDEFVGCVVCEIDAGDAGEEDGDAESRGNSDT